MQQSRALFAFVTLSCFAVLAGTLGQHILAQVGASTQGPRLVAPARPVTDDYYGAKIVDPYRYMENIKDPEVQSWIKAQDQYTKNAMASISGREELLARIKQLGRTVPQYVSVTLLPGDRYLLLKRLPSEDVSKLYLRSGLRGEDKLLVDPQTIKLATKNQGKGKNVILYLAPSLDEKYVALGIAPGGSEKDTEIHVIEVTSGRDMGDVVPRAWTGAPSWLPDNRSFVYGRLQKLPPGAPVTETEQKFRTYLHVLRTDGEKDAAVFGFGVVPSITVEPTFFANITAEPNSAYALGSLNSGVDPNSAFYVEPISDLTEKKAGWRRVANFSDDVADVRVHGDDLYVLTYKNAPRYKVLRIDARNPDLSTAETVVSTGQAVVETINPAADALYVQLLDGGISRLLRVPYGPHPQPEDVALPAKGNATLITDPRLPGAFLALVTWASAAKILSYDPKTKQVRDTELQPVGPYDNPANIETAEIKIPSYDRTQIPLSITYPKGLKRDGSNPTILEAYGAYGIPFTPSFDPTRLAWHEKGGIYAVCHVRGGGEYGEEWHLAGKQATKPSTWRDFIACAQYLIDQKYTSASHLAGEGTSAGGIMIGRSFTERPDLFAAAIDRVGCSDTLRMETTANGVPNIPEFGSTKTEAGFKALYEMSPYAHIKRQTAYPAVMFETGMNDPRVDPWQMAKMTAQLQASSSSGRPVLLRVEYEGGHGGIGGTEAQRQSKEADEWSFLLWQFGEADFRPYKNN